MRLISSLFIIVLTTGVFAQKINTSLLYLVNKPAKITSKTPVLVILHGYGSSEKDPIQMAKSLQDKFIVFSLRAPHTTTVGGFAWFPMQFLEWAQFKSDYKQTEKSRAKILSFISNACRAYKVDSTQVFLMGFSQGGMMAYDIALSAPTKVKGVLALSTRLMEETMLRQDLNWPEIQKVKFLLVGGYSDKVISFLDTYKAHDFLKTKGVWDLGIKFYDIPHTITPQEIIDLKGWLENKTQPVSAAQRK